LNRAVERIAKRERRSKNFVLISAVEAFIQNTTK
jgi:predicted transcriptional regulator